MASIARGIGGEEAAAAAHLQRCLVRSTNLRANQFRARGGTTNKKHKQPWRSGRTCRGRRPAGSIPGLWLTTSTGDSEARHSTTPSDQRLIPVLPEVDFFCLLPNRHVIGEFPDPILGFWDPWASVFKIRDRAAARKSNQRSVAAAVNIPKPAARHSRARPELAKKMFWASGERPPLPIRQRNRSDGPTKVVRTSFEDGQSTIAVLRIRAFHPPLGDAAGVEKSITVIPHVSSHSVLR